MLFNSNIRTFLQYVAIVLLAVTFLACLGVATFDLVNGIPQLPNLVQNILTIGIGYALNAIGIQQGVQITKGVQITTQVASSPVVQQQGAANNATNS